MNYIFWRFSVEQNTTIDIPRPALYVEGGEYLVFFRRVSNIDHIAFILCTKPNALRLRQPGTRENALVLQRDATCVTVGTADGRCSPTLCGLMISGLIPFHEIADTNLFSPAPEAPLRSNCINLKVKRYESLRTRDRRNATRSCNAYGTAVRFAIMGYH